VLNRIPDSGAQPCTHVHTTRMHECTRMYGMQVCMCACVHARAREQRKSYIHVQHLQSITSLRLPRTYGYQCIHGCTCQPTEAERDLHEHIPPMPTCASVHLFCRLRLHIHGHAPAHATQTPRMRTHRGLPVCYSPALRPRQKSRERGKRGADGQRAWRPANSLGGGEPRTVATTEQPLESTCCTNSKPIPLVPQAAVSGQEATHAQPAARTRRNVLAGKRRRPARAKRRRADSPTSGPPSQACRATAHQRTPRE